MFTIDTFNLRSPLGEKSGLEQFESLAFLSDVALIRKYVGDNLHHLRKLASIRKAGYYQQPDYLKRPSKSALRKAGS